MPGPITSLPVVLTQPGYYYLTPQAVANAVTAPNYAIVINGSGITLDLRDLTVNCAYGVEITNGSASNSGVTVESTPNGGAVINSSPASGAPVGLVIMGNVSNNTVTGVTFTGLNKDNNYVGCNNQDNGSNDTIKFCSFTGLFFVGGDHETFKKNSLAEPAAYIGRFSVFTDNSGQANSFKLNSVTSGNVQLLGTDTYQNNSLAAGSQIFGGKKLGN